MISPEKIKEALKRYWGYDAFRPKQEEIVRNILDGRDVCVVMPTGGGKSLCYQMPAVLQSAKTAIVVSPLIALMQDQAAQLAQMGIPAVVLNSSQSWNQQRETERRAEAGEFRFGWEKSRCRSLRLMKRTAFRNGATNSGPIIAK